MLFHSWQRRDGNSPASRECESWVRLFNTSSNPYVHKDAAGMLAALFGADRPIVDSLSLKVGITVESNGDERLFGKDHRGLLRSTIGGDLAGVLWK
jgi:hypothetical protein